MELCSLLFIFLGYLLLKKEKINIMHDYHYKKVRAEDKKAYTSIMGKAMIVIGLGMMFSGIFCLFTESLVCMIPFGITVFIGICLMIYGQLKYKHGIF
ncbi:MAG: DUF3784 domain-containing protein [Velocimicrobium sp.]